MAVHREGNRFLYELTYDGAGKDGAPFVTGLLDVEKLRHHYEADRLGVEAEGSPHF